MFGLKSRKRRVTVDTGLIVAAVIYGSAKSRELIDTVKAKDELVMTNIILLQCTRQGRKKKCPISEREIERRVREMCPDVVYIELIPLEQLKERYSMRDDSDLEVLYSADMTDSQIIIASDHDFHDPNNPVKGVKAKIMWPDEYLDWVKKR
jgi:predicted nucleic acid-binding protein